jgi:hypothetical protein
MSKPQKPLLQKSLDDRKRKFEETPRAKAAALLERGSETGSQDRRLDRGEHNVGDKMPDDPRRVNDRAADAIGSIMPDGSIYAGMSPDTGKAMYATPADASLTMTFNEVAEYAKTANSHRDYGHDDWRVPTKAELNVLFNNRGAIGGFSVSGSTHAGWYWSATPYGKGDAWGQRFGDGYQSYTGKGYPSSVRLVR